MNLKSKNKVKQEKIDLFVKTNILPIFKKCTRELNDILRQFNIDGEVHPPIFKDSFMYDHTSNTNFDKIEFNFVFPVYILESELYTNVEPLHQDFNKCIRKNLKQLNEFTTESKNTHENLLIQFLEIRNNFYHFQYYLKFRLSKLESLILKYKLDAIIK